MSLQAVLAELLADGGAPSEAARIECVAALLEVAQQAGEKLHEHIRANDFTAAEVIDGFLAVRVLERLAELDRDAERVTGEHRRAAFWQRALERLRADTPTTTDPRRTPCSDTGPSARRR